MAPIFYPAWVCIYCFKLLLCEIFGLALPPAVVRTTASCRPSFLPLTTALQNKDHNYNPILFEINTKRFECLVCIAVSIYILFKPFCFNVLNTFTAIITKLFSIKIHNQSKTSRTNLSHMKQGETVSANLLWIVN